MSRYGRPIFFTAAADVRGNGFWNGAAGNYRRSCPSSNRHIRLWDEMARRFLSLFCSNIADGRLTKLVEWCDRYSPLVSQDGSDGVILDITGCAHLFRSKSAGEEGGLLLDMQHRLHRMGIAARASIADTRGAAWALARYSDKQIVHGDYAIAALNPLPVEALHLPHEIAAELPPGINHRRRGEENPTRLVKRAIWIHSPL